MDDLGRKRTRPDPLLGQTLLVGMIALQLACAASPAALTDYGEFRDPQRVTIRGYDGEAMEPFVTPDGRYLLFNNSNDPSVDTNLHYALRMDPLTWAYKGEIAGVNSTALDAVPAMDASGTFYFVSTRDYEHSLSTIFRGRFADGVVTGVELVPGVSPHIRGTVDFDVDVTPDGLTLYVAEGIFKGGPVPAAADIVVAARDGNLFRRSGSTLFEHVNSRSLEYAVASSADGLELFFTRLDGVPTIYRAARATASQAFDAPRRIGAIQGFVEAPALADDGRTLYYHSKEDGKRFAIYRVTR